VSTPSSPGRFIAVNVGAPDQDGWNDPILGVEHPDGAKAWILTAFDYSQSHAKNRQKCLI